MKIEYVAVSELKPAEYNPADRIEERILKPLLDSIKVYGILSPIQIDSNNNVADGHRRLRCAELLGINTVPVIRVNMSSEEAWSELNSTSRKISPKEWGKAFAGGLPAEYIPGHTRNKLVRFKELLGDKFPDVINKYSIHIYSIAKTLSRYVYGEEYDDFIRSAVFWMIKHNQQIVVRRAIVDMISPDILLNAVEKDVPIRKKYELG